MTRITRIDPNQKLSRIVLHNNTAYLSGLTATDKSAGPYEQTRQVLARADELLGKVGSDRSQVLIAHVFLRNGEDFDEMNRAWIEWLDGVEPPARITVGSSFALDTILVEIQFTAAA